MNYPGTIEWTGDDTYLATAEYKCGLYSKYVHENGSEGNSYDSVCYWNKTWSLPKHENCEG